MDNGLLSSVSNGNKPIQKYSEVFEQQCPYYLSIGMTIEQYWDGDCHLTKYFREAEKKRFEQRNRDAWLQGMYIYDALARVSPIFNPFAKKGTKSKPYPSAPYPIGVTDKEDAEIKKEKADAEKGRSYIRGFAAKFNQKFKKEGGER